jgi:hypothetical protein
MNFFLKDPMVGGNSRRRPQFRASGLPVAIDLVAMDHQENVCSLPMPATAFCMVPNM